MQKWRLLSSLLLSTIFSLMIYKLVDRYTTHNQIKYSQQESTVYFADQTRFRFIIKCEPGFIPSNHFTFDLQPNPITGKQMYTGNNITVFVNNATCDHQWISSSETITAVNYPLLALSLTVVIIFTSCAMFIIWCVTCDSEIIDESNNLVAETARYQERGPEELVTLPREEEAQVKDGKFIDLADANASIVELATQKET